MSRSNEIALDKLKTAKEYRKNIGSAITLGNKFLDDACGGILREDLVIVTARTGGGKTELTTQIAGVNAELGKKVSLFALEAHQTEITQRLMFKKLSQAFFTQVDWMTFGKLPNYQDWMLGFQEDILSKFEQEVDLELAKVFENLAVFYRSQKFDISAFEAKMARVAERSDLIIIDHLHYFDFDGDNENQELKRTVKQIKEIQSYYGKPCVLVVQLRKQDKKNKVILPDIEDIHGSSDIAKIATKIIITAPARGQATADKNIFPTYFKVLKNRMDGSRCYYTALCGFDSRRNSYARDYTIGRLSFDETEFEGIAECDIPHWAKRG